MHKAFAPIVCMELGGTEREHLSYAFCRRSAFMIPLGQPNCPEVTQSEVSKRRRCEY